MLLAAEFGTGEVLWSILWFTLFFLWIWLVITIFADIMTARDMSGWAKAMWAIGIIILPFLGVFMYLIIHGNDMNRRGQEAAAEADQAMQDYIRNVADSGSSADQLAKLRSLHDAGSITDEEYSQAKAKILS